MHFSNANFASSSAIPTAILPLPSPNLACFRISHRKTHRSFLFSSLFEFKARRNLRVSANSSNRQSSNASTDLDVPFPRDYSDLLNQAKKATEAALRDNKQLMEIEFPTAGLESVPGDGEGGNEMTESMQLIRQFCDCFIDPLKATRTRVFFPEANEVKFARNTAFEGVSFKLDYLTKPSFFEDFGFVEKVKMADRVKPEDELFLVAYPYFNVNEMLVVEELYKEAVQNTTRKLIIFNGELDRIRSGCILLSTFLLFNEERVWDPHLIR
ncbi:uncharacterized protein LOC120069467 isoform X4 [Benincasa hispida]|uniref:uncharacterized protein LOC120069467 isoform X4 n=1 Tax=Benincasa hispida TaxID=102211 RepID=UPI001902148A|nr:uncharacterized protein LOC120069467 isoform X4 [Benincasa hispida]